MSPKNMALFLLALVGVGFTLRPAPDPDLWGHLRFGQYFLDAGLPPLPDIFSYASTLTWYDHEWLCEIVYFLAWRSFGDYGYYLVKAVTGAVLAGFFLYHMIRSKTPLLPVAIVFCLAFLCLGNGMLMRPQLFTYVFIACIMHVCIMEREGRSGWLYACPFIMAVWANAHAGVVAGLGVITLFCAGDSIDAWMAGKRGTPASWLRPKRFLAMFVISAVATLATPYGLEYWKFLWHATTLKREYITEWRPLAWVWDDGAYILCAGVFSFALIRSRLRKSAAELLVFVVTLYLGLSHRRHMMLFAIANAMTIAPHVTDCFRIALSAGTDADSLTPRERLILRAVYSVSIVLMLSAMSYAVAKRGVGIPVDPKSYPVAAARFILENKISGNLYPTFNWGQYAIWHLHPQCQVGADGRYETVYSKAHEKIQMAFDVGFDGWEAVVDTWPTEIVLCPNRFHLRLIMDSRPGWAKVYEDTTARIYLKRGPKFDGMIEKSAKGELAMPKISAREFFP